MRRITREAAQRTIDEHAHARTPACMSVSTSCWEKVEKWGHSSNWSSDASGRVAGGAAYPDRDDHARAETTAILAGGLSAGAQT